MRLPSPAHLELRNSRYSLGKTIANYVCISGFKLLGKKWKREVLNAVAQLKKSFIADYVVLGGGFAHRFHRFHRFPKGVVVRLKRQCLPPRKPFMETKRNSPELKGHVL